MTVHNLFPLMVREGDEPHTLDSRLPPPRAPKSELRSSRPYKGNGRWSR